MTEPASASDAAPASKAPSGEAVSPSSESSSGSESSNARDSLFVFDLGGLAGDDENTDASEPETSEQDSEDPAPTSSAVESSDEQDESAAEQDESSAEQDESAAEQDESSTEQDESSAEQVEPAAETLSIQQLQSNAEASGTLGCTVWPISDLTIFRDDTLLETVGTAEAQSAYEVLGETEGLFYIASAQGEGFISSDFCLIDVMEYLPGLCQYDITNSYSSKYRVHGCSIPGITGTIIPGYESVYRPDGSFYVPLLYGAAQKLAAAAEQAWQMGYTLRIYDAFRPGQATRFLYDETESCLNQTILPEEAQGFSDAIGAIPSYAEWMTGGIYALSSFLAKNGSAHNLGIAVDLTLVDRTTGLEVEMQTDIHDLSWYSATPFNNENATRLADIMTGAGFSTLSSEWWHFQDNATRNAIGQNTYRWDGISRLGQ